MCRILSFLSLATAVLGNGCNTAGVQQAEPIVSNAPATEPIVLRNEHCAVTAHPDGRVVIADSQNKPVVELTGIKLCWHPMWCEKGQTYAEGTNTVVIRYEVNKADDPRSELTATVRLLERGEIAVRYTAYVPEKTHTGGTMFIRRYAESIDPDSATLYKLGNWQRHPYGVPFESTGPVLRQYDSSTTRVFERLGGNVNWSNRTAQHIALKPDPEREAPEGWKALAGQTSFLVAEPGLAAVDAGAILDRRPISIRIDCPKAFHLWEPADGNPHCQVRFANTSLHSIRRLPVSIWVKDYDGNDRYRVDNKVDLAPGAVLQVPVTFPVPEPRNIFFVEATISKGKEEVFARTTMGILPPYEYTAKHPILGLAAAFDIPSKDAVDRLLQRMGVCYLRRGDDHEARKLGMRANWHNNVRKDQFADDLDKKTATLEKWLRECDERGNAWWEFCNEWNMAKLNTGANADIYVRDWLVPLADARKRIGAKVKLQSMGLAGPDIAFLEAIHANGGWPLLDGLAIHPGRGNYTPDYTGNDFWTYLGCIRRVKEAVNRLGPKPIWVTEAYACTQANNHWTDTARHAAENIVLTYALGVAEGLSCVMLYQLHDSVWHNKGGINPKDREYDFGILHRDDAIKPSLLAYCAIAEALDGAEFRTELTFPNPHLKGFSFNTPRGPMSIIWSRADGYILNGKGGKTYGAPEAWVDPWKTKTPISLPAGSPVTIIDAIGRKTEIEPIDEHVTLVLDGAPQIVYGLDLRAVTRD